MEVSRRRMPIWFKATLTVVCLFLLLVCVFVLAADLLLRQGLLNADIAIFTQNAPDLQRSQIGARGAWKWRANLDNFRVNTYELMNAEAAVLRPFTFSTNEHGLRGGALRAGSAVRVLAIGDSTTFGFGCDDAETWPALLEDVLNGGERQGPFEVVNAGIVGFSAYQGLQFLRKEWITLEPDIVIATFGNNDWEYWSGFSDSDRMARHDEIAPDEPGSVLLRLLRVSWQDRKREKALQQGLIEGKPRVPEAEFRWCLEEIARLSRAAGAQPIFIVWPWQSQLDPALPTMSEDAPLVRYQEAVRTVGHQESVAVVDLFKVFGDSDLDLYFDTVHVIPEGNAKVAEAVAQVVRSMQPRPHETLPGKASAGADHS